MRSSPIAQKRGDPSGGAPQSLMQQPHAAKQGKLDRYDMNVIDSSEETLQMAIDRTS